MAKFAGKIFKVSNNKIGIRNDGAHNVHVKIKLKYKPPQAVWVGSLGVGKPPERADKFIRFF